MTETNDKNCFVVHVDDAAFLSRRWPTNPFRLYAIAGWLLLYPVAVVMCLIYRQTEHWKTDKSDNEHDDVFSVVSRVLSTMASVVLDFTPRFTAACLCLHFGACFLLVSWAQFQEREERATTTTTEDKKDL